MVAASRSSASNGRRNAKPIPDPAYFAQDDNTSDLENLQPMRLSALTKALLGDQYASDAPAAARSLRPRERSPPPKSAIPEPVQPTAGDQESSWRRSQNDEGRRTPSPSGRSRSRARSQGTSIPASAGPTPRTSPTPSRENSPAPRKRVVRLSSTKSASGPYNPGPSSGQRRSLRNSLSSSTRGKRPESADGRNPPKPQSPVAPQNQNQDVETPVVPVRTVRIAAGSSAQKRTSMDSSEIRSRYNTRSNNREDQGVPAPAARQPAAAPQGSMRVKRVAKVPGSFLSGPARRGLRRQSEEDVGEPQEADAYNMAQEAQSQQPESPEQQPILPSTASKNDESAASGSPLSARVSALAALRQHKSTFVSPYGQSKPESDHLKLAYRAPAQSSPHRSNEDKENDVPPGVPSAIRGISREANPPASITSKRAPSDTIPMVRGSLINSAAKDKILAPRPTNPQRSVPPPPPKMSVVETATTAAGASTAGQATRKKQFLFRVNGRTYTRIDTLGRGGSGKVYRVSAESGKILALKRVTLENLDQRTIKGYHGEIDLLKRLTGVNRVIQLIDHEFNAEKQMLSIVLEAGELDFLTLLRSRAPEESKFDPVFVRYWWKEMLECVQAVHAKDIIHSDLKPQNFVIAQGRLKVIDFGIANAIQTDMTTNVHRDAQVGTPNYMSPESLMDFKDYALTSGRDHGPAYAQPLHRAKHFKLGKACDVWSLGCILYQLVYGTGPFAAIPHMLHRVQAIIDWNHVIEFPEQTEDGVRVPPSLLRTMRRCLQRDSSLRPSCTELLAETDPFLYPVELSPAAIAAAENGEALPITQELLRDVIWNVVDRCRKGSPTDQEALQLWPVAYWTSCKKVLAGSTSPNPGGSQGQGQSVGKGRNPGQR